MSRLYRAILAAMLVPAAAAPVAAQETMEEVIVTGSFIRGTPEDAALPVEVMSRQDLDDIGNPTITEMVRNLGIANGNLGETNQFNNSGGQGNEGVATINLRGLGSARSLVLINGRRHVAIPTIGVDISAVPSVAIGRLEVLKDGAAALYGSDAIAGVVNFITRENFEGIEIRGSFQNIEDADRGGDQQIGVIGGWGSDRLHVMGAFEYEGRGKLRIRDRDWAIRPQPANPQGGYSTIGNPGRIFPVSPSAISPANPSGFVPSADPECETLGGTASGSTCFFQFTQFDNLIEEQNTYKAFGELNYELTDSVSFHLEGLYAKMDMPDWNTSPSYPPQSLFGPDRSIPLDHPGVVDFRNTYPGVIPADTVALFTISRMAGFGGVNGGQPEDGSRETDTYRVAAGLDGTLFDDELGFDLSVSWSRRERLNVTPDMYVERMGFALDGLGGPDCDPATGTPGAGGCMYYTPFSNAVAQSYDGRVNPNANPDLAAMNEALFPWLVDDLSTETTNELLVFDLTFDGVLPIELAGGNVGWAAGVQARNERFTLDPATINDLSVNPCPFRDPASITLGHTASLDCTSPTGLFAFLSGTFPDSTERTVYGGFAEFAVPITDRLDAQLAVRFEDYGGAVGHTIDPKFALRFQATDAVALRGSISTTFRGPPQPFLTGQTTALQFVPSTNAFKAVDTIGNPDLDPETALTTNLGVIVDVSGFYGSLDYWRFDFEDPFQIEDFNGIIAAYSANGCAAGGAGVGSTVCNQLENAFTFQTGGQGNLAQIERIRVNYINGTDITTSGVDWLAQYDFSTDYGEFTVGTQGTYTIEYDTADFVSIDGVFLSEGGDFAGNLNDNNNALTPILDFQGNVFGKWNMGRHNATVTVRYWGEYDDPGAISARQTIDSMTTVDLTYNLSLLDDQLNVNLSVFNAFDEDPPLAQTDLNYDPYTHSAFGRMIKLGVIYNLGM